MLTGCLPIGYVKKKKSRMISQFWPKQLKTEPSFPKTGKTAEGMGTIRNSFHIW